MNYQITGKTAILNGMDLTALGVITRAGYSVEYVPVDGGQGGLMQDGSTKEDELGIKTIVSFPLMPMQEYLNSRLLKTVYDSTETRLTYFDPKTGKDRTMRTLRGRLSPMTYRGFGGDGNAYWTHGSVLVFEERTPTIAEPEPEPSVVELKVVSPPIKTYYNYGEPLDLTGLRVSAVYSDDTERDVTDRIETSPANGEPILSNAVNIELDIDDNKLTVDLSLNVTSGNVIASGDWWTLYETGLLRVFCDGDMPDWEYSYRPWSEYLDDITSVAIESGVTSISDNAFEYCENLRNVTIPDSVTSIGDSAFGCCVALTGVTIPDSVTSIGDHAFDGCVALTGVTIPDSVTSIGDAAFTDCTSLTGAIVGNNVTSIGDYAFLRCENLISASFPICENAFYDAFAGCTALESVTLSSKCTIGNYVFSNVIAPDDKTFKLYLRGNTIGECEDTIFDISTNDFSTFTPAHDVYSTPIPGLEIYVPENLLNEFKTTWAGGAFAANIFPLTD